MEQRVADNRPKPWENLEIRSNNQSVLNLIDLVNQGIERKDKDGVSISEENADFMIAIGTFALETEKRWIEKFPKASNVDPFFVRQAQDLVEKNRGQSDKYIEELRKKHGEGLTTSQISLFNEVMTRLSHIK